MRVKVLLLLAVCMAVIVGAEMPSASVEDAGNRGLVWSGVPDIGASIAHPKGWVVERERYSYDDTYGYTLWRPESNDSHDHGGSPAVRVALAPDLTPKGIKRRIQDRIEEVRGIPVKRATVRVGERKLKGSAVGPIPGSTPSWEVYVPVDGDVYQINLYGEKLGAESKKLLSSIKFDPPARSSSSLRRLKALPDAENPQALRPTGYVGAPSAAEREARRRQVASAESPKEASGETTRTASATRATSAVPAYAESRIAEGCWRADSRVYFQTQHGWGANGRANDDYPDNLRVNIPTGYTVMGRPNYWGQYTHGSLNYGRCASPYYTNDKFAVDYPLNRGDYLFSPFSKGVVTFVGRNSSHKDYGIFVVIKHANGKYVSMSAHLSALNPNVRKGTTVYADTVIGYAGNTSYGNINPGYTHLHQAFYRYPKFLADGSPYAGQGLQVIYHHYAGRTGVRSGGVYQFGYKATSTVKAKGSLISN